MVNGSHYLNGDVTDTPAYRRIGQTILDRSTVMNSGVKITDLERSSRLLYLHKRFLSIQYAGIAIESKYVDAGSYGSRLKEVIICVNCDIGSSIDNSVKKGFAVLLHGLYFFTDFLFR